MTIETGLRELFNSRQVASLSICPTERDDLDGGHGVQVNVRMKGEKGYSVSIHKDVVSALEHMLTLLGGQKPAPQPDKGVFG